MRNSRATMRGVQRSGAAIGDQGEIARHRGRARSSPSAPHCDILVVAMRRCRRPPGADRGRAASRSSRASAVWSRLRGRAASRRRETDRRRAGRATRLASVTVGSLAAVPVADRAGRGAGAFRPDAQRAASRRARDAAAAGADLLNIDHRDLHRQARGVAADQRAAGHQHVAVMNDAGLGGRAAHVEGDGVRRDRCCRTASWCR